MEKALKDLSKDQRERLIEAATKIQEYRKTMRLERAVRQANMTAEDALMFLDLSAEDTVRLLAEAARRKKEGK